MIHHSSKNALRMTHRIPTELSFLFKVGFILLSYTSQIDGWLTVKLIPPVQTITTRKSIPWKSNHASSFIKKTKSFTEIHTFNTVLSLSKLRSEEIYAANPLPNDETIWKAEGERIILKVASDLKLSPSALKIEWKSGKVIITVLEGSSAYIGAFDDEEEEEEDGGSDEIHQLEQEQQKDESESNQPADVVSLARAINEAFALEGEGSVGYAIAVHNEIEVTTPGASNVLSGIMFESYKGFDVIVDAADKKTGKVKAIEGRLVERKEDITIINIKGRMKKISNDTIDAVRLPKAKKEKGTK